MLGKNSYSIRKINPFLTSFASFTVSVESFDNDAASFSRLLSENVDLPAIFRTIDQGVVPGLILTIPTDEVLICSGNSLHIDSDKIIITFAPMTLLGIFVSISLTKTDSGGTAIRIPGSAWYLEASTQSNT